jgi:hypothetical protein
MRRNAPRELGEAVEQLGVVFEDTDPRLMTELQPGGVECNGWSQPLRDDARAIVAGADYAQAPADPRHRRRPGRHAR